MYAVCQLQPHLGHAYTIELELRTSQCVFPALENPRHPPWAACSTMYSGVCMEKIPEECGRSRTEARRPGTTSPDLLSASFRSLTPSQRPLPLLP